MSSTPLMKQYSKLKENHKDAILLFRLGDFYETFYEDAEISSKILNITLTARNKEKGYKIPMSGFPHHAASSYISKLIDKGYKVAVCEQLEEPSGKGIVKREVVKVITPGTFSEMEFLDAKSSNYIASFCLGFKGGSISYLDLTTGEFSTTELTNKNFESKLFNELFRISPKEIILGTIKNIKIKEDIEEQCKLRGIAFSFFQLEKEPDKFIKDHFKINSLKIFNLEDKKYTIISAASLLKYVSSLQNSNSLKKINYIDFDEQMHLDYSTQENLDLIKNKRFSLLTVLDKTKTSMGARLLKRFITSPLINKFEILKRQGDVEYFIENPIIRSDVTELMKNVYDVERLLSRILRKEANCRDLNLVKNSLESYIKLYETIPLFLLADKSLILNIYNILNESILETSSSSIKDGEIINPSFNSELEELYKISNSGQEYILNLENEEKVRTGIKSLKIRYNKIFGYYIEITALNVHLVPKNYIRRQTLANAERYITLELKDYEDKILGAREKINVIEYEIFKSIVEKLNDYAEEIEKVVKDLSYIDVVISLAESALKNKYIKPIISEENIIEIKDGRHPIVECINENFISNDILLKEGEIIILTGPNMSGKSTYMKQVAIIVLLAQIGSFVPATYAKVGIVDKIFTRIGSSDDLLTGQSTFMVEMNEVSNILNNSTSRSFIVLDEVGRGTSTFDGISIAKAMTEYIHNNIKAKTIFATHYHELNALETILPNVVNYRFEVSEDDDKVTFLKKIVKGGADRSYGIEVARLAGLPEEVIEKSKYILSSFKNYNEKDLFDEERINNYINIELNEINIDSLTPIEAFKKIISIKKRLSEK